MAVFNCLTLAIVPHGILRMLQRTISRWEIDVVLATGIIIDEYPYDKPYPSVLLLGFPNGRPLHLLVAHDAATNDCLVITLYQPDPDLWNDTFTKKKHLP